MNPAREKRTVAAMIGLYCRARHSGGRQPCAACGRLLEYALRRVERCRLGPRKPVCSKCRVHCYAPGPREAIRRVMRFAGPRMLLAHPLLALLHLADAWRAPAAVQK
jgi:hypothetical protein